jgi:hypothetical protein
MPYRTGSCEIKRRLAADIPDSLEMHGTDLDHVSRFLTLQNPISFASAHTGHIQQFCAVDVIVVYESIKSVGE